MSIDLQRGFEITADTKIKKLIVGNDDWGIYISTNDKYVLVFSDSLFSLLRNGYDFPYDRFIRLNGFFALVTEKGLLISSVTSGPYPDKSIQIYRFSSAFNNAVSCNPTFCFEDAIFIEEFSIILPTKMYSHNNDIGTIFGHWITAGVNIAIDNIDRIAELTAWMPKEILIKCADIAGFTLSNKDEPKEEMRDKDGESKISFKLVGRPELERFFIDNIINIIENREKYNRMGIGFPGATVLYGLPGCGKTFAVNRIADYLGWPIFSIDSSSVASPYIHDTSKKIAEVFQSAIDSAPSILIIDEMESFLSNRNNSSADHHVEEVAEFLRRIPEAVSKDVLIFAMTNMIDKIDPAVIRRGRFDYIVEVKMPSKAEVLELLKESVKNLPVSEDVDLLLLAEKLENRPMSDVSFVLREAGKIAVNDNKEYIEMSHLIGAVEKLPNQSAKKKNRIGFLP